MRGSGGSQRRPPWWPDDEPFPPTDREAWRRNAPRHFRRRIGFVFLAFFLILFLTSAVAVGVLTDVFGVKPHHGLVPLAALFGVLILAGFIAFVRWLRRMAAPVDDVMTAADRVASGDYSVRVAERGPGEMRRLARSFNQMTERLGSDEERRRALLADVAHELRTPLAVIQGNTEGMIDGLYPADRQHLATLLEEAKVMARLLQDLQTLSTAEAGQLVLHREPTTARRLADDAVASFAGVAADKGVSLRTSVPDELPDLNADPFRIGEVLSNLLANAVRHTPHGGSITIAARRANHGVAFAVTDTGPGIPAEQLPDVFDRYVKAADTGGSGLGLAIARTLVQAHGGTITAANEPGGGATIRFTLPIEPAPR